MRTFKYAIAFNWITMFDFPDVKTKNVPLIWIASSLRRLWYESLTNNTVNVWKLDCQNLDYAEINRPISECNWVRFNNFLVF